ncbi:MAG: universal stress protein [Desulfuromonadales bacterium]
MKSILLATDIAPETDRALERAINLATTLSAKLHILHVSPEKSFSLAKKPADTLRRGAEVILREYLQGYGELQNLKPTVKVIDGREVYLEIVQYAEKVKAGLIVMGMHGKASVRDMFAGTTIERVIRKGIKPVLMVRNKPQGDYGSILVGTDFSAGSKQAFHVALEVASKGSFHLVHSYDIPETDIGAKIERFAGDVIVQCENNEMEKFIKESRSRLKKSGIAPERFHPRVVQGAAFSCLMREAKNINAELIAIGTHSRTTLLPYKLGGTAQDILSNPPCDVLVAKGI